MGISINLLETNKQIVDRIHKALPDGINSLLVSAKGIVTNGIRDAAKEWLASSPELSSLQRGDLQKDFGIPSGQENIIIQTIIDSIVSTVRVDIFPAGKNLKGSVMKISVQPSDFQNLLNLSEGKVQTEKGESLPWLNWLLVRGDDVIVVGYRVESGSFGRSGLGHMVGGSAFRINSAFSGTLDNNFIHRAFENREDDIAKILKKSLKM